MLETLITVVDIFDESFDFVQRNGNEGWKKQFELQAGRIEKLLLKLGLVKIGQTQGETVFFDAKLHAVEETCEETGRMPQEVVKVLKNGYIYGGSVIRKTNIILNTRG